jgi:hypothetical protein
MVFGELLLTRSVLWVCTTKNELDLTYLSSYIGRKNMELVEEIV